MQFKEDNKNIITVAKYENCFIYFLLNNNEVVYVGQTKHGLKRPLSHTNKEFDEIKILYCKENELDITEDKFIQKYKPIYNKQNNHVVRWSLVKVKNCIRAQLNQPRYSMPKLKKVLKTLNIVPEIDYFNGKETILFDEYKAVMEYLRSNEYDNSK